VALYCSGGAERCDGVAVWRCGVWYCDEIFNLMKNKRTKKRVFSKTAVVSLTFARQSVRPVSDLC